MCELLFLIVARLTHSEVLRYPKIPLSPRPDTEYLSVSGCVARRSDENTSALATDVRLHSDQIQRYGKKRAQHFSFNVFAGIPKNMCRSVVKKKKKKLRPAQFFGRRSPCHTAAANSVLQQTQRATQFNIAQVVLSR